VPAAKRKGEAIAVRELSQLFSDLGNFQKVLLAVSGGPDSTALLMLAQRWRSARKNGPALIAATVDHRLRTESKAEALAVAKIARSLRVPHHTLVWAGRKPSTGLQQAAREARYSLLADLAHKLGAQAIVTAHTLDDQAETFLMRLARGSGVSGLGGIRANSMRGNIVLARPFLGVAKRRLIESLRKAKFDFALDPSNADPRFLRPRLRRIADELAAEGLTAERLAGVARRLARVDAAIEATADALQSRLGRGEGGPTQFPADLLLRLPDEISLRLLGRAVERAGIEGPVELGKLEALHDALREARTAGKPLRRTLAGAVVGLDHTHVTVARAPARRGRKR
jgi:tRNA(Ile)-lysidine synthase